ncbi:hypothetical protein C8Q76DRAFT_355192 [Earliella scabrosa]|nr:hypothetical protein C8Q76DRAFT_355192 [Earliella scabrosa]
MAEREDVGSGEQGSAGAEADWSEAPGVAALGRHLISLAEIQLGSQTALVATVGPLAPCRSLSPLALSALVLPDEHQLSDGTHAPRRALAPDPELGLSTPITVGPGIRTYDHLAASGCPTHSHRSPPRAVKCSRAPRPLGLISLPRTYRTELDCHVLSPSCPFDVATVHSHSPGTRLSASHPPRCLAQGPMVPLSLSSTVDKRQIGPLSAFPDKVGLVPYPPHHPRYTDPSAVLSSSGPRQVCATESCLELPHSPPVIFSSQ